MTDTDPLIQAALWTAYGTVILGIALIVIGLLIVRADMKDIDRRWPKPERKPG